MQGVVGVRVDLGVLDGVPEAGDPEAVDAVVAGYVARAQAFEGRAGESRAAAAALVAVCAGSWVEALAARVERLSSGWADAGAGCAQVAEVMAGYGAQLRVLIRQVRACRHEVGTARARALAARDRYEAAVLAAGGAGSGVGWSWTQVPAFPAVAAAADELDAWRTAVGEVAAGLAGFEECCRQRADLDASTARALAGLDVMSAYAPGSAPDAVVDVPLVQALAASAAGTSTTAQRDLVARWFVDVVGQMLLDPTDEGAREVLESMLATWGDDGQTMSDLMTGLGGARLVRLLTALGQDMTLGDPGRNAVLARTGAALRRALAAASSQWTNEQADRFAGELLAAASSMDGTLGVIGFVFADPRGARMGQELTVAMADLLDEIERTRDAPWRDGPGTPGHALHTVGTLDASNAPYDPAAHVLATLGEYPQAARDWLVGADGPWGAEEATYDESRLAYWFLNRDWGATWSDGFAGIGALWAGAQHDVTTLREAQQLATLNSGVFAHLSSNRSFTPANLSDAGAAAVADAVRVQLRGLVEVGLVLNFEGNEDAWVDIATGLPGTGGPVAVVTPSELGVVLVAAAQGEGRAVLERGVAQYQADVIGAADDGAMLAPDALKRLALTWGAVDGAIRTAQEEVALADLEKDLATVDALGAGAGQASNLLPVPAPVAMLISTGLDEIQGGVEDHLRDGMVVEESPTATRTEYLDGAFASAIDAYHRSGRWGPSARDLDTADGLKEAANELTADYMRSVDAVRGALTSGEIRG